MKWPRLRRRKRHVPEPPVSAEEAAAARAESEHALREARARSREVHSLARRLAAQRANNNFAKLIADALREGR